MGSKEEAGMDHDTHPRSSSPRWRRLRRCLWGAAIVYLGVTLVFMLLETSLVYPGSRTEPGQWPPPLVDLEDVQFASADGTQLHGAYFAHPEPRAVVLYCHGNGDQLAYLAPFLDAVRSELRVSIFAFDYRGFGQSDGSPNEAGILADGEAARAWLAERTGEPLARQVLMGRSLGGGVAMKLAGTQGARGLILERTFTSLVDVAARQFPWLPVRLLMRNRFQSLDHLRQYTGPVLISHGTADRLVPLPMAHALLDAAGSDDKRLIEMPGVGHNGPDSDLYRDALDTFFDRLPD